MRAREVLSAYTALLDRVHVTHCRKRPWVKLARLFMALLPAELTVCFSSPSHRSQARLLLGSVKVGRMDGAVLARARLREVFGQEMHLQEHVERATFCWWLYENEAQLVKGEDPFTTGKTTPPRNDDDAPLKPVAPDRLIRGLTAVKGYQEAFRAVVMATEEGATRDEIVETMQSDMGFDKHKAKYCRTIVSRVRRHGFLEHRGDGFWYPSARGEQLLDEDPPNVLVEDFLTKFFGLGHTLQIMEKKGPMIREDLFKLLRDIYPSWKSHMVQSSIAAWGVALDLLEEQPQREGKAKLALTEYGRSWLARLPEDLPVPRSAMDGPEVTGGGPTDEKDRPGLQKGPNQAEMIAAFSEDEEASRFIFSHRQLSTLHLAWHALPHKRFVLLSGLSGTGKTQILRHYARLYCQRQGLDHDKHTALVAVAPDWRDPTGLLGYFNALHSEPTFQVEPALQLLLRAAAQPALPFFLLLDEMNLSRVERYFAPFLSAMETGERIALYAYDEEVNDVPSSITWPDNLFIGGTVNMDETTHPFSDKVLDRAFTLEFWEVDLAAFFKRRAEKLGLGPNPEVEALLLKANGILTPIRRHFGYRTADEICAYVEAASREAGQAAATDLASVALDSAVYAKVLPRLRGSESVALDQGLEELSKLCNEAKLQRCQAKLEEMRAQLKDTGITRFWS